MTTNAETDSLRTKQIIDGLDVLCKKLVCYKQRQISPNVCDRSHVLDDPICFCFCSVAKHRS